jgi:hypothetical protein
MKKRLGIILLALVLIQFTVVNVYCQDKVIPREKVKDLSPEELQELEDKMELYFSRKTMISSVNSLLMAYIMWFYYSMYRENGSKFSLGLIALSAALLVYSFTSNPWIIRQYWYLVKREAIGYRELFDIIPELFTTITAVIMIYLTRT